jgi:hypothetical protein
VVIFRRIGVRAEIRTQNPVLSNTRLAKMVPLSHLRRRFFTIFCSYFITIAGEKIIRKGLSLLMSDRQSNIFTGEISQPKAIRVPGSHLRQTRSHVRNHNQQCLSSQLQQLTATSYGYLTFNRSRSRSHRFLRGENLYLKQIPISIREVS